MVDIHGPAARLTAGLRARRLAAVCHDLDITAATRVLDVGGTRSHWNDAPVVPRLTLLNVEPQPRGPGVDIVVGDGCRLPFADGAFAVVYSNSVIEHLGTADRQAAFAGECCRVGRAIWVQTPDRWCPIEPHYVSPLVHWLPSGLPAPLRRWLVRYATVWGLLGRPSAVVVAACVRDLRLLTAREMTALFPGARIRRERVLGLTKSLIAVDGVPH